MGGLMGGRGDETRGAGTNPGGSTHGTTPRVAPVGQGGTPGVTRVDPDPQGTQRPPQQVPGLGGSTVLSWGGTQASEWGRRG